MDYVVDLRRDDVGESERGATLGTDFYGSLACESGLFDSVVAVKFEVVNRHGMEATGLVLIRVYWPVLLAVVVAGMSTAVVVVNRGRFMATTGAEFEDRVGTALLFLGSSALTFSVIALIALCASALSLRTSIRRYRATSAGESALTFLAAREPVLDAQLVGLGAAGVVAHGRGDGMYSVTFADEGITIASGIPGYESQARLPWANIQGLTAVTVQKGIWTRPAVAVDVSGHRIELLLSHLTGMFPVPNSTATNRRLLRLPKFETTKRSASA